MGLQVGDVEDELQAELETFSSRLCVASALGMWVALPWRQVALALLMRDLLVRRLVVRLLALRELWGLQTREVLHHADRTRALWCGLSCVGRGLGSMEGRACGQGVFGPVA